MKIFLLLLLILLSSIVLSAQTPHFNHTTILVVDMNKSADFYEKAMMLTRISEPFHDNKHIWEKIGDHNELHIVQGATAVMPHDINIHLAFSVPSIEEFAKHLDSMNVNYGDWSQKNKAPQVRPDGVKQIYFQDPDGYWIEVNDDKF